MFILVRLRGGGGSGNSFSSTFLYTFAVSASMWSSGREDAGVKERQPVALQLSQKSGATPTHRRMNVFDLLPQCEEK